MSPPNFAKRHHIPEIMDDLQFSGKEMDQALKELELINRWLGGNAVTLRGLNRLTAGRTENKPLHIVDLGCGGGDMLILILKWSQKKNVPVRLTGIDANPYIVDYARKHCVRFPQIQFQVANIFDDNFQEKQYDVVISTLFTHHFSRTQLAELLPVWLRQARLGIVINDLHRHWMAYYSIVMITRVWSRSYMVKNDGPVSVLRAFRANDWRQLLKEVGVDNYFLCWKWAFRWLLVIPTGNLGIRRGRNT